MKTNEFKVMMVKEAYATERDIVNEYRYAIVRKHRNIFGKERWCKFLVESYAGHGITGLTNPVFRTAAVADNYLCKLKKLVRTGARV